MFPRTCQTYDIEASDMSKRARTSHTLPDPDCFQSFYISSLEAIRNAPARHTEQTSSQQTVSLDTASADKHRILRESLPIPPIPAAAASSASPAVATDFDVNAAPITLQSIPYWDSFFRDDEESVEYQLDANTEVEEHARRYINSVSLLAR